MTFFGTWVRLAAHRGRRRARALAARRPGAGAQVEELLAPSVVTVLSAAISDRPVPSDYGCRRRASALDGRDVAPPRGEGHRRPHARGISRHGPLRGDARRARSAARLGVIQYESAFRKYAISTAGARGYMQVMPFWTGLIGGGGDNNNNLFHLRTNLRYGCVILRHYLDKEGGDVYRALGRYNGSLGRPEYPTA